MKRAIQVRVTFVGDRPEPETYGLELDNPSAEEVETLLAGARMMIQRQCRDLFPDQPAEE